MGHGRGRRDQADGAAVPVREGGPDVVGGAGGVDQVRGREYVDLTCKDDQYARFRIEQLERRLQEPVPGWEFEGPGSD